MLNINERDKLKNLIFYKYDIDDVELENPTKYHSMTNEHEEILGQFLDFTGLSAIELKELLINGYISKFEL